MDDTTDRYDRFVSEMRVFKTAEEAWAAHDAHKTRMEEERAKRHERLKARATPDPAE